MRKEGLAIRGRRFLNKTIPSPVLIAGHRLSENEISAEAHKRLKEMRGAARAAEMAEEDVALEKVKVLAKKEAARMACSGEIALFSRSGYTRACHRRFLFRVQNCHTKFLTFLHSSPSFFSRVLPASKLLLCARFSHAGGPVR